jgi:hypothetical protein
MAWPPQAPWNIIALLHRETLLFDPRVLAALREHFELDDFVTGQNGLAAIWKGTQLEYDAISTKDPNTLYLIYG